MSERHFDNQANRDALDRHLTTEPEPPYPEPRQEVRQAIANGDEPNAVAGAIAASHQLNDAGYLALLAYAQGFADALRRWRGAA